MLVRFMYFVAVISLSGFAACGGGGSSTPPAPPGPAVPVLAVWADPGFIDQTAASDFVAALLNRGIAATSFSGTTAAEWTAGLAGANIVVEPAANTNMSWVPDAAAQAVIQNFVQGGGRFLLLGTGPARNTIPNSALGLTLGELGNFSAPISKSAAAAGTAFDACLAILPVHAGSNTSLLVGSLPAGSTVFYTESSQGISAISMWPIGAAGRGGFFGWAAVGAVPTGALDGGWLDALDCLIAELLKP